MSGLDITTLRHRIDAIDREIVSLLAARFAVVRDVAAYKQDNGIAVMQPDRVREVVETRGAWAAAAGLDPVPVQTVFQALIDWACREEER